MSKIFLIPGLGADTRIYNKIDLNNHEVICVDWIEPNETDTLATYAQNLILQYHITPNSIVIGNSLGGMIAVEIAKKVPLKKVILISSIKSREEEPFYFKLLRIAPFYKFIPGKLVTRMELLVKPFFGHMNPEDNWLFRDMLKNSSPVFLKWAMNAVLHWHNQTVPQNLVQITGDKDRVFPAGKIEDAIIVRGGTHVMIFEKAKEVNKILKRILEK